MPVLTLKKIVCRRTQEAIDEPYLRLIVGRTNEIVWGPCSMDDGETATIEVKTTFWQRAWVQLWEHDRLNHDYIGDLYLNYDYFTDDDEGEYIRRFGGARCRYDLHYTLGRFEPPPTLHTLTLLSLKCNDAQELKDEPYLIVNGRRVWSAEKVKTGQTRVINQPISFAEEINVELWESDGSKSDWIGTRTWTAEDVARGIPETPHRFHRDRGISGDATYTLTYEAV